MHTPGVRIISISDYAQGDVEKEAETVDGFLPFILRAWNRFVRLFLDELIMRNDTILGKVQNIFYRFEFQGAGAKGNKPHVHCGITLEDEPESVTVSRICCDSLMFHSAVYGGDYETLKSRGVFETESDYKSWVGIVRCVQHHDCSKTEYRCLKKTDSNGNKICRYRRQPLPAPYDMVDDSWFVEMEMPYGDDVYELLEEMRLAKKEGDKWVVTEKNMKAGKWNYLSRRDEFFLSSIPLVSAICGSSTNVDMCDRKFQVIAIL